MFSFFDFLWLSFMLLAPMLLLGLFLSGVIHVFISREAILRWLRDDSLKSVSTSAAVGVPMPLCSCSVVPVVAEMRRKGASRSACMSFLITAPETGADSILVTNAFFGPIVAIARPIISFITAVVAGIFCIGSIRDDRDERKDSGHEHHEHDHDDDHCHDTHCHHDHGTHESMVPGQDDCYVSFSQIRDLFVNWLRTIFRVLSGKRLVSWVKPKFYRDMLSSGERDEKTVFDPPPDETTAADSQGLDFKRVIRHILHYGFVDIADDILFSLLVGILLGGLLFLVIPGDLASSQYTFWAAYPIMVLLGVPLYICASASTPIAAALVAKGFSPGAALVFLMTGPATNTATIAIIAGQFGNRFTSIYVGSVIVVTVLIGIAVDVLLLAAGIAIPVTLQMSSSPAIQILQWASTIALAALIIWRFRAGAMKSGYEDLMSNLRPLEKHFRSFWRWSAGGSQGSSRGIGLLCVIVIVLLLSSGFTTVRPGTVGYGRLFGQVYWRDLEPGLHYLAPRPFVKIDKWPVREVKSIVGASGEYVSGDLNLLSIVLDIQYRVKDPYVYHYRITNAESVLGNFVKQNIRDFVSNREMDLLLNAEREALEKSVSGLFEGEQRFTAESSKVFDSVELIKINLLSINPLPETFAAFRQVSNAQDDKERIIVDAQRFLVSVAAQVHGNAYYEVEQAEAKAYHTKKVSGAEASAIRRVARAVRSAPAVLRNMLWREKLETALSNKPKIIVPNEDVLNRVALWKRKPVEIGTDDATYNNFRRKEE